VLAQFPEQPDVDLVQVDDPRRLARADALDVVDQEAGRPARDRGHRRVGGPLLDDGMQPEPSVVQGIDATLADGDPATPDLVAEDRQMFIDPGDELGMLAPVPQGPLVSADGLADLGERKVALGNQLGRPIAGL
jgi:hypothetical protein